MTTLWIKGLPSSAVDAGSAHPTTNVQASSNILRWQLIFMWHPIAVQHPFRAQIITQSRRRQRPCLFNVGLVRYFTVALTAKKSAVFCTVKCRYRS